MGLSPKGTDGFRGKRFIVGSLIAGPIAVYLSLCFHFHAYQPGDIILRKRGSPMEPPEFIERRSPVSLMMGKSEIKGDNWTDAMLRFYGAIWKLFGRMGQQSSSPFCSVDIEPATLQLLAQRQPNSFWAYRELIKQRAVDPIATVPFHVLLPHADPEEQRFLGKLTFRLHRVLESVETPYGDAMGFWFPEALYSDKASHAVAQAYADIQPKQDNGHCRRMLFFILDRDQFENLDIPQAALSANFAFIDTQRVGVFGRDRPISDRWAFRHGTIPEMVSEIESMKVDPIKEEKGIQYTLTVASDLESLAASAEQGDRFQALRAELKSGGVEMLCHSTFLGRKLGKEYRCWEGELEGKAFRVRLRENSSWSDYMDLGVNYPSDTRWTGLRRWDGHVIFRWHGGDRISQIWKQGYGVVWERLSRAVRLGVYEALGKCMAKKDDRSDKVIEAFLLEYSNLVFTPLYVASGMHDMPLEFKRIMDKHLQGCGNDEAAAFAARAYFEMLMANRSCPRFWENIDTRVTFQSTVFMAHALLDIAESCSRLGMKERAGEIQKLFLSNLVDFRQVHSLYQLGTLFGFVGWEVREDAWFTAIQSEVPERSGYDVVKRAALFAAINEKSDISERILGEVQWEPAQVVADTGHIDGEGHGKWNNPKYCEHRA
jgi:hypothetical protein